MSTQTQSETLAAAISAAIAAAIERGDLVGTIPVSIPLERPKNRDHGDYATSIALQLAKPAGMSPRAVAELLQADLLALDAVSAVEIAGPGFINITLNRSSQAELVRTILSTADRYGVGTALNGVSINLEFISANPTGPLHLGHTRWAAVGDALGQPIPEDGYQGGYINDLADAVVAENPGIKDLAADTRYQSFREAAYKVQLAQQQGVLDTFNTHFDVWFSERSLHEAGAVEHGIDKLRQQGHVFDSEGAIWLRTTDFGDDKDRVITKANGDLTYFASDTAYYINKRERGFDICIYMLGADHHGYVNRLRATAACAGDNPDYNVEVLIGQLVKIMEGGEEVKLSKRAGTIITLEELVEKVGVDAARYTLIRYPVDTPMVMDIDILRRNTNENPVYYVQYAHARIAAVLRNVAELSIPVGLDHFDPSQLTHDRENELLGTLTEFPGVVAAAAQFREPHRIARYLEELAGVYHGFYADCRVLPMGDEVISPIHSARANLCAATKQVLKNGLDLLGVSAPERM
jgi:arginyl-tRNA synthetase